MENNINKSANNKRIAKNTLMLYFRMLLMMGVTLYTSRVVLSELGVEDYGIYNVVGGVVAMFTMISTTLSTAISRFITFELGRGNQDRLKTIFATSVIIQLLISLIIVLLVESVGIWFLTNKMVIPVDRMIAAKWVLHFSTLTLVINLISVPYNAAIIAHERMSAFAYISILEAFCKLGIAYLITISPTDKLIFYAILMALVAIVVRLTYSMYCRRHFEECKFKWVFDKDLFKEMFGFAGWNFIETIAGVLKFQGENILLNILGGGAVVNAAKGISSQVITAVTQFSSNFMTALNPQITKSYASGNREYMMTLVFQGARLSFYMLLLLSLPVFLNTSFLLELWLKNVPDYSVDFVQLSLIVVMCESLSNPLTTAMLATGKIKKYQIVVGGLLMLNVPLSYVFLKLGFSPNVVLVVAIFIALVCLLARLYMLRGMIGLSITDYLRKVVFNVFLVSAASAIVPYCVKIQFDSDGVLNFVVVSLIGVISTMFAIYTIGCNRTEKKFINGKVVSLLCKGVNS